MARFSLEILAHSGGPVAGMSGRPIKHRRNFDANCAVQAHLVVVSTPSLAFPPRFVETEEAINVERLGAELAAQAFD